MKIFKYLLTVIIAINAISVSAFAQTNSEDIISPERKMAVSVLEELEIISNVFDQEGIKREEFALIAAKLLNYEDREDLRKVYFTDVPIDNRFSGAIAFLVDKGAITIPEDRKFYPKENITLVQVYTILFQLTGYGDYINNVRGGFPTGYLNTADDFKVDVSVKDANSISLNEVCEIIYKFGNLGLCTPEVYYGGGNIKLSVDSENTLFSVYKSLYASRGVLTNTYTNALNSKNVSEENSVIIDSDKYYCNGNDVNDYFADYVEFAYIKEEKSPYEGRIVSMYTVPGKKYNIDKFIDSSDIVGFDSDTYTLKYENENKKVKSEKIRTDIEVIYNGSPVTGLIENYINEFIVGNKKGRIHLKGYGNDDYSYLIIESYVSCVIGQVDSDKKIIYDKNYNYNIFKADDYDGVSLMNHKSDKIKFGQLAPKNIINVAESKDKRFLKIILCSDETKFTVSGKISRTDEADKSIELDNGNIYTVDRTFWQLYENNLSFSITYIFYLDYFGEIAYAEIKEDDNFRIGYLVNGFYSPYDLTGVLKIYDSTGVMEKFNLAEKPKIDKEKYKTPLHAMAAIPGTTGIVDLSSIESEYNKPLFEQQVIRYKLNTQGEICEIDTRTVGANEDEGNTLTMHVKMSATQRRYDCENYDYMRVGKDVLINRAKTIVFNVPNVDEQGYCLERNKKTGRFEKIIGNDGNYIVPDDTMYKISSVFYEEFCYVDCYNYDSSTLYADIAVLHSSDRVDLYEPMMVGKKVITLNSDDEPIVEMECYNNQNKSKLYFPIDFDLSGINKGDIIRAYSNKNSNMVGKITKVFDRETMLFVNGTGNAGSYLYGNLDNSIDEYDNEWQLSKGYSVIHDENVVRLAYDFPTNEYDYDEVATINPTVIIYDEGEIYLGSSNEIKDFAYAGSKCSTIVVHSRWSGVFGGTFVYK